MKNIPLDDDIGSFHWIPDTPVYIEIMLKVFYIKVFDAGWEEIAAKWDRLEMVGGMEDLHPLSPGHYKRQFTKLVGERMLRYILQQELHIAHETVSTVKNAHGKPYWKEIGNAYYNISHSGEYLVCAFSHTEIGVDIQKIAEDRMEVARRFFHPVEIKKLEQLNATLRKDLFFTYWSVKESFLKQRGTGIAGGLASFWVETDGEEICLYDDEGRLPFFVTACPVNVDYKCFVCSGSKAEPQLVPLTLKDLEM